jgi:hypothetical protein
MRRAAPSAQRTFAAKQESAQLCAESCSLAYAHDPRVQNGTEAAFETGDIATHSGMEWVRPGSSRRLLELQHLRQPEEQAEGEGEAQHAAVALAVEQGRRRHRELLQVDWAGVCECEAAQLSRGTRAGRPARVWQGSPACKGVSAGAVALARAPVPVISDRARQRTSAQAGLRAARASLQQLLGARCASPDPQIGETEKKEPRPAGRLPAVCRVRARRRLGPRPRVGLGLLQRLHRGTRGAWGRGPSRRCLAPPTAATREGRRSMC